MVKYKVLSPNEIHYGSTYSSLVSDWLNWFVSADADKRNSGPVVFLRSLGLPPSLGDGNGVNAIKDQSVSSAYGDDQNYARSYENLPNVRIGADRLQIYQDQAVLVPIIVAFEIATKPYDDWGAMQDFTGLTIDNGDNPPDTDQLTIDGVAIDLGPLEMSNFRIRTPMFTAVIPETDYGRSVKDFLEHPVPSGIYPAIVEGYFVLMTFEPGKPFLVHSWASAPRERAGPYFSELYYEIDVNTRKPKVSRGAPGFRLGHNEGIIKQIIQQKKVNGEITQKELTKYISNAKL